MMHLFVLLTLVFVAPSCQYEHTIYVNNHLGDNNKLCRTSNSPEHACQSLQYALGDINNSTEVLLEDGLHPVDGIVNTTGMNSNAGWLGDIKIAGLSSGATVDCSAYNHSGAGLLFSFIQNLYIANLTFSGCGGLLNSTMRNNNASEKDTVLQFRSAVYVVNCTHVVIESSMFMNGSGIGLVLFDTNGIVSVSDSYFSGNMVPERERVMYPGGGGMYIEHTYCTPGRLSNCDFEHNPFSNNSVYTIQGCSFHSNHATTLPNKVSTFVRQSGSDSRRLGKGGAIAITLKGRSVYNNFTISGCNFTSNSAAFGGGLDIQFQDYVSHNSFLITDCRFQENTVENGAAATRVGLVWYTVCPCVSNNAIHYRNTDFIGNSAKWGGAMDFFSSRLSDEHQITNYIKFTSCSWIENSAETAAAINLSPEAWSSLSDGYLPVPVFEDCEFTGNRILNGQLDSFLPSGILFVTTFTVNFTSTVSFSNNIGTSVYANIARINVLDNAEVTFSGNQGTRGGALALIGFSSIRTFPNSTLTFRNNTAVDVGGAIYAPSSDEIDFVFSRSCFIRYADATLTPDQWEAFFYFENNEAARYGHSIYASSLLPCARSAQANGSKEVNVRDVFRWRTFHYTHPDKEFNIASEPANVTINATSTSAYGLRFSPGQVYNLHPVSRDDLDQSVKSVFKASLSHIESGSKVELDRIFDYVSDGRIKVKGTVGSTFELNLQTTGTRKIGTSTNVTLIGCPPGYVITSNSSTPGECVCSATTDNRQYEGVTRCDVTKFQALLRKGFWIGCLNNSNNLAVVTSECPLGYCRYIGSADSFVLLPQTCEELDSFLCRPRNRTGLLCGECQEGMSVYFHSQRFFCGNCSSHDSRIGWLFYIVSELVPLTILFAVIMIFSISLTSGLTNSLVFFMQVLDFFEVNSLDTFTLPVGVNILTAIYRFLFGIFNMDFLRFDAFSFCLWDGATVLDMLCFKYVTTACALALLSLLFLGAKFIRVPKWCSSRGKPLLRKNSITDGVAAFIIMSYAQCAKVSFQILTRITLRGEGLVAKKSVIFLSGNVEFFGYHHLAYAVPAIFILLTLCTVPPIILIAYPAAYNLFASCQKTEERLTESIRDDYDNLKCAQLTRCCKLDRLKPLLDSFQGCYKDHFRFFAGLYFVYRLAISAAFAFTTSAVQFYTCLEVVIIAILAMHAIAQPYQRRYYNIVDALIFANLAVINGLSLYDYYWSQYASTQKINLDVASSFQVLLIYIPILYMAVIITLKVACRWKRARYRLQKLNEYVPLFEGEEDYSKLENEDGDGDCSTQPFNEAHFPARLFELEDSTHDSLVGSARVHNYGINHTA